MRKTILLIILLCALLSFLACDNCNLVRCEQNGDYVQLRILREGKNAVFGPDAFIARDSIMYSNLDLPGSEALQIIFHDSTQTIKFFIKDIYKYQLELGTFRTDTIEGITSVVSHGKCCVDYELKYVYINGEIVCFEDCGEAVEVEI